MYCVHYYTSFTKYQQRLNLTGLSSSLFSQSFANTGCQSRRVPKTSVCFLLAEVGICIDIRSIIQQHSFPFERCFPGLAFSQLKTEFRKRLYGADCGLMDVILVHVLPLRTKAGLSKLDTMLLWFDDYLISLLD